MHHQLKRTFLRNNVDYHSKPGPKLGDVLCSANKTQPDPMDLKGIYMQTCDCDECRVYIGQTRVSFRARMKQHSDDVTSNKLDANISGISKHARECQGGHIDWEKPKILATFNDKNKSALTRNLLIRENLEIRKHKSSSGLGLNDPQLCIRSNAWDPILSKLRDT